MTVILICYLSFHHSSVAAAADSKSPKDEKGKLFDGVQLIIPFVPVPRRCVQVISVEWRTALKQEDISFPASVLYNPLFFVTYV